MSRAPALTAAGCNMDARRAAHAGLAVLGRLRQQSQRQRNLRSRFARRAVGGLRHTALYDHEDTAGTAGKSPPGAQPQSRGAQQSSRGGQLCACFTWVCLSAAVLLGAHLSVLQASG